MSGWVLIAFSTLPMFGAGQRVVDVVREQDSVSLRALLAARADVNAAQGDGATALHWAAHWNEAQTALQLIRAGAKVNAADDSGTTPLSLACLNANPVLVKALLDAGANPNVTRSSGETPLMTAALTGNVEVVKMLLEHGAQTPAKEISRGQTSLMRAVAANHPDVVRALIAAGADVRSRSTNSFTALLFAAQQGNLEIARQLLAAGSDVNEMAPDGVGGDTNARIMYKPDTEAGALLVAIDSGHPEMAKFLIEKGAAVNQNGAGRTPLHSAVQRQMPDVVELLLSKGADPNARLGKLLPLMSRYIFQQAGIDTSIIGATPFWLAAYYSDVRLMKLLLEHGADPKINTNDQTTPLMAAAGVDFIEGQDRRGHRWLQLSTLPLQLEAIEAVKVLLGLGSDVNAVNNNKQTALHGATYFGSEPLIQLLVDRGARLDAVNKLGQTPYYIAQGVYHSGSFYQRKEAGDLLRRLGADISIGANIPHIDQAGVN